MELGGMSNEERRSASSATGTDSSQVTSNTPVSEVDEENMRLLPSSTANMSDDGRIQPLLQV